MHVRGCCAGQRSPQHQRAAGGIKSASITPHHHLLLLVEVEEKWIYVGFGGQTNRTDSLVPEPRTDYATGNRLLQEGDDVAIYHHQHWLLISASSNKEEAIM